jgi:CheY-like chemotaxis protein
MYEEPRELLQLVCSDFREMYPNRAENYCCTGGGGAMSMSEYTPRRLKSGVVKANQLEETGAEIVVTSCHNCVDGLTDVIRHYELGMEVTQLVNLVANALVIEPKVAIPVEEEVVEVLALAGRTLLVADDEPDQVVLTLDLAMPGRDVGEVYELLRDDPDLEGLKVCVITGRPELRKLIYDRHVRKPEGYLDKPVSEDSLVLAVRKILELAHEEAAAPTEA